MEQIAPGARGPAVKVAQRLLNRVLRRAHGFTRLSEDGIYGRRTEEAVTTLQALNAINAEYGYIGATTWRAMGLTTEIDHRVTLHGQQYDSGCWSAAAAMVMGIDASIGPGLATLSTTTMGLDDHAANVITFANVVGGRAVNAPTTALGLVRYITRRPAWFAGYARLGAHRETGHAVVISGLWSDGTEQGTLIRIHDPWPPGHGAIYATDYPRARVAGYPFRPYALIVLEA